jgi:hypothetical protein
MLCLQVQFSSLNQWISVSRFWPASIWQTTKGGIERDLNQVEEGLDLT